MSVWVVVGGQYGSEGKGKIAAFITLQEEIDICVRCGGPNSGHCFVDDSGELKALRQIPTGYVRPGTRLLIPSGGLIDLEVLRRELEVLGLGPARVGIDHRAMIIEQSDHEAEKTLGLKERLSSTLCGVGSAVSRRVLRGEDVRLAQDIAIQTTWLKPYLVDVSAEVNDGVDRGKKVLVEGTQGSGLSLYHSSSYPKATSRDTNASGFLSEVGVSPRLVSEVILVFRTYPIRVAGDQAGPLEEEITWEEVRQDSGSTTPLDEYTTVTGKLRRVGRFELQAAHRAVTLNRPTRVAVNFADYLDVSNSRVSRWADLSARAKNFVNKIEDLGTSVDYIGTGPRLGDLVVSRATSRKTIIYCGSLEAHLRDA
jgi:adenylosuccinate synthase